MKYSHRVSEVEARQVTQENVSEIAEWCQGVVIEEHDPFDNSKIFLSLNAPTRLGGRRAGEGDYVVEVTNGRFEVHGSIYFETAYEPVR